MRGHAGNPVGTPPALRERVARYYDETQVLYSNIWSAGALHYGFWDGRTRRRADAIRAMDRFVARELGLAMGSRVLDAGCGIGGTSIFLAEELHHRVLGITLSSTQLARAQRRAARCRAPEPPSFEMRDFLATGYGDASFDGVIAVESVSHADSKGSFLREAYRLLRPGGRLVVSDGFLGRAPSGRARTHYERFIHGVAVPHLAPIEEFLVEAAGCGFEEIRCFDKQREILPSARAIARLSRVGVLVCWVPCRLGVWPKTWMHHGRAGISQRVLFESGVMCYRVVSATKPSSGRVAHMTS